jgi:hypothetical protein
MFPVPSLCLVDLSGLFPVLSPVFFPVFFLYRKKNIIKDKKEEEST